MPGAHEFLRNLALVLCVAAVITVLFQRLRQPVVLGYLLAGMVIGPNFPVSLVADREMVTALAELGVTLLMFSLGLEFRLRKLVDVAPAVALIVVVEVSLMLWLGFVVGRLLGWSPAVSLAAGAAVAISSTTIIAKAFDEQEVRGKRRDVVFGILVFEDLVAILLLAALTAASTGHGVSTGLVAVTAGRLVAFLVGALVGGMVIVPRLVRAIVRVGRPETIVVATVGLCFALALLAHTLGYPVALGAFLAGALVAESGEERRIAPLVRPVRDMFAAIFFVAVGMSIDTTLVLANLGAVAALSAVVLLGKAAGVGLGTFLAGHGVRTALQSGLSLGQIGEFSFIIAGLGHAGAGSESLYPIAVAVSAVTTLTTPWLIRVSGPVASFVDNSLPRPLQTYASLYGSWVDQLRQTSAQSTLGARVRRLALLLLIDAGLLAAIVVGTSLALRPAAAGLAERLSLGPTAARLLVLGAALGLATPFCLGIVQLARRLGRTLAELALPAARAGADLAAAPRRALIVTLELASVLLVGAPLVAVTQPFLPPFQGAAVFLALLVGLGIALSRSATNLEGHVRAGAQMIVEALATQSRRRDTTEHSLEMVNQLLPGLGAPVAHRLAARSPAIGKTLAQLNLRGATGATVLAITRGEQGLVVPSADEVLRDGDVLALAGTHEAIAAATALLDGAETPAPV